MVISVIDRDKESIKVGPGSKKGPAVLSQRTASHACRPWCPDLTCLTFSAQVADTGVSLFLNFSLIGPLTKTRAEVALALPFSRVFYCGRSADVGLGGSAGKR